MKPRSPTEWHELSAELERLLAEGQAAPIRLLLQARFLQEIREEGESVWSAFGYPVGLALVQRMDGDLARFGEAFLQELADVLGAMEHRRMPPWAREADWASGLADAHRALERESEQLRRAVGEGALVRGDGDGAAKPAPGAGSLLVPVILRVQSGREVPELYRCVRASCLIRLTIEAQLLYRRARAAELTVLGAVDPETLAGFEEAVRFLGRASAAGTPSLGHHWFRLRWDLPGARLSGRSATLGFLLAAQSAHEQYSLSFGQRSLADGVAVTGDLRDEEVVEVESIAEKVQACFYGGVRLIVVPASQREQAVREVRRLEERYPGGQLLVLGASRVNDLWREPAVSVVRMRTGRELLRTTLRRVAVSRAFVAVLIGVFLILAGLGGRELWRERPWPVDVRWEREHLVLRNASGQDYHREHLSPGTPAGEVGAFQRGAGRIALACNLDDRGRNEVVAIAWNLGFEGNDLRAWSGRGGSLWSLSSQVGLLDSPFVSERLNWKFFTPAGADHAMGSRLLAVRRSRYGSLSLLDLIDSASGRRVGLLANQGHLGLFLREDVDQDGTRELLAAGTENREEAGILLVLDLDRMALPPAPWGPEDVLWVSRPAALDRGVRAALRFPKDRLRPAGRPDCVDGQMQNGLLLVTTETEGPGRFIIFSLDLREPSRPVAVRALLNDSYRDQLVTGDPGVTKDEIAREEARLVGAISYLTPDGWKPVSVREGSDEIHSGEGARRD